MVEFYGGVVLTLPSHVSSCQGTLVKGSERIPGRLPEGTGGSVAHRFWCAKIALASRPNIHSGRSDNVGVADSLSAAAPHGFVESW
jgi:hypothetical protein